MTCEVTVVDRVDVDVIVLDVAEVGVRILGPVALVDVVMAGEITRVDAILLDPIEAGVEIGAVIAAIDVDLPPSIIEVEVGTGMQGETGPQGPPGEDGAKGDAGAQGPIGPAGPQGVEGPRGVAGADGAAGAVGPAGAQGDPGPIGTQGPAGEIGPQGPQGAEGQQGPQGVAGSGITMKGSVPLPEDLPAAGNAQGDAYIVQADDSLWLWDGSAWVSGGSIQGPPGSQGPQGPQGAEGPAGASGAQGVPGDAGATGADGPEGAQGPQGLQGDPGAQGPEGAQGPIGAEGPQGPIGADGAQGPKGDTGAQGVPGTAFPDAPNDAKLYGRKSLGWSVVDLVALGIPKHDLIKVDTSGSENLYKLEPGRAGHVGLVLNTTGAVAGDVPYISAQKGGSKRWQINLADGVESGNSGSDVAFYRYNNTGGASSALSIKRVNGAATFSCASATSSTADYNFTIEQTAAGQACYLWFKNAIANGGKTIRVGTLFEILNAAMTTSLLQLDDAGGMTVAGGLTVAKTLYACGGGMAMYLDPAGQGYNYLAMGSGPGPWSWRWNRTTGLLEWLNQASQAVIAFDGSGFANAARYVCYGGTGLWVNGIQTDNSTYALQSMAVGNPSYNTCDMRTRHQYGQWAGWEFICQSTQIRFTMSNGLSWGSIQAISFDVQSDARRKREIVPIVSALDVIEGVKAYTFEHLPLEDAEAAPVYGQTRRHAGSMAQDWQTRLPEAVTDSGDDNLMVDYAAVSAVTAQAVSELLARVKTLEARIAALEDA